MAKLRYHQSNFDKNDLMTIEGETEEELKLLKTIWESLQFGSDRLYLAGGNMNNLGEIIIGVRKY